MKEEIFFFNWYLGCRLPLIVAESKCNMSKIIDRRTSLVYSDDVCVDPNACGFEMRHNIMWGRILIQFQLALFSF